MKVLLYLCFILFVIDEATGQTPNPICADVPDFALCPFPFICNLTVSRCICYQNEPFCRCHTKKGEFYLDEDCTQSWTVVTFALVASLPGLTLAVLVGVIVYMIMLSSNKSHKGESKETTTPKIDKEQDLFPGIAFASDMNGRPPTNMRPGQQDHVPMKAMPNRPYSLSSEMRDPQMGGPARPYGPSSGMRPSVDRMSDGRPHEPNIYNGMREPPMGGPMQPYSNGGTRAHVVSNPYARDSPSRNPYDNHIPSSDHHSDHISHASSPTYDDLKHNHPYSAAPPYGSSDHGFPRPQFSQRY
ncbi:uncharacterized protein zgc:158432 [Labeo rohita]|uniref:uncharacterized protein zgc:158432 n=1 Tax=Labeo rohita TaxID=84645 RepID=UPI0021E1E903|nr:uncharacterized protein zgc:158432 [Labeo rohita]